MDDWETNLWAGWFSRAGDRRHQRGCVAVSPDEKGWCYGGRRPQAPRAESGELEEDRSMKMTCLIPLMLVASLPALSQAPGSAQPQSLKGVVRKNLAPVSIIFYRVVDYIYEQRLELAGVPGHHYALSRFEEHLYFF